MEDYRVLWMNAMASALVAGLVRKRPPPPPQLLVDLIGDLGGQALRSVVRSVPWLPAPVAGSRLRAAAWQQRRSRYCRRCGAYPSRLKFGNGTVTIETRLDNALTAAWEVLEAGGDVGLDGPYAVADAAKRLIMLDSAPDRGMVLAIAAGTAEAPSTDPGALQEGAGVDRRGQAKTLMRIFTAFREAHGLTIKISQEPGVSHPWRALVIDQEWLSRRSRLPSAPHFVTLVGWLRDPGPGNDRARRAENLLDYLAFLIVKLARASSLAYPRFRVSPRLAMSLLREFLDTTPNRPDAVESVVSAAAKAIAESLPGEITVERRDTNSPDPIDVLVKGDHVDSGIEVTDEPITLSKLQHEVVPAMLQHGLSHAVVVSRPPAAAQVTDINAYLEAIYRKYEQRIDLLTVEDIEKWLALPGLPGDVASKFVWEIGPELDRYSATETRRAWHAVLQAYVGSASS